MLVLGAFFFFRYYKRFHIDRSEIQVGTVVMLSRKKKDHAADHFSACLRPITAYGVGGVIAIRFVTALRAEEEAPPLPL